MALVTVQEVQDFVNKLNVYVERMMVNEYTSELKRGKLNYPWAQGLSGEQIMARLLDVQRPNHLLVVKERKKYIAIDTAGHNGQGGSGKLLVDKETGLVHDIKAYGVVHPRNYGHISQVNLKRLVQSMWPYSSAYVTEETTMKTFKQLTEMAAPSLATIEKQFVKVLDKYGFKLEKEQRGIPNRFSPSHILDDLKFVKFTGKRRHVVNVTIYHRDGSKHWNFHYHQTNGIVGPYGSGDTAGQLDRTLERMERDGRFKEEANEALLWKCPKCATTGPVNTSGVHNFKAGDTQKLRCSKCRENTKHVVIQEAFDKPTKQQPKFKVGDRVKASDAALERDRSYLLGLGRTHPKYHIFDDALRKRAAKRGTVTSSGYNGYAMGADVKWDDGTISQSMEHMLMPADQPRLNGINEGLNVNPGEMVQCHCKECPTHWSVTAIGLSNTKCPKCKKRNFSITKMDGTVLREASFYGKGGAFSNATKKALSKYGQNHCKFCGTDQNLIHGHRPLDSKDAITICKDCRKDGEGDLRTEEDATDKWDRENVLDLPKISNTNAMRRSVAKSSSGIPTITRAEVEKLKASGRVAVIYPKKGEVSVDGFKRYKLVEDTFKNIAVAPHQAAKPTPLEKTAIKLGWPTGWNKGFDHPYKIGAGGSETPFQRDGKWKLRMWNSKDGRHYLYDYSSDIYELDEDALKTRKITVKDLRIGDKLVNPVAMKVFGEIERLDFAKARGYIVITLKDIPSQFQVMYPNNQTSRHVSETVYVLDKVMNEAFGNLGVHVNQFPSGRWGYVGTLPRQLGDEVPATADDAMAGRSYKNAKGEIVTTKFPVFATSAEAIAHAKKRGVAVKLNNKLQEAVTKLQVECPECGCGMDADADVHECVTGRTVLDALKEAEDDGRAAIEAEVSAASAALKAFPKGPMGLTPDSVKSSPEYREAKARYARAFAALRTLNTKKSGKGLNEDARAWFKVTLNGKEIDKIQDSAKSTPEDVKRSLVDHDGYDPNIKVTKEK